MTHDRTEPALTLHLLLQSVESRRGSNRMEYGELWYAYITPEKYEPLGAACLRTFSESLLITHGSCGLSLIASKIRSFKALHNFHTNQAVVPTNSCSANSSISMCQRGYPGSPQ